MTGFLCDLYVTERCCLQNNVGQIFKQRIPAEKVTLNTTKKAIFCGSQSAVLLPLLRQGKAVAGLSSRSSFQPRATSPVQGITDWTVVSTKDWSRYESVALSFVPSHFFLLTLGFLTGRRYGLSITLSSLALVDGTTPLGGSMEFSLSAPGSSWMIEM